MRRVLAMSLCTLVCFGLPGVVHAVDPSDKPEDGKVYIISNLNSGKRLAIADGSKAANALLVQDDASKTHVTWRLEKTSEDHFRIVNTKSNLSLDIPDGSKDAGVQIQQWKTKTDNAANQEWEFIKTGHHYAIRSKHSKLVLDVKEASKDDGAAVIQFPLNDKKERTNQLWILTEVKK
jgi:hypothetical protein